MLITFQSHNTFNFKCSSISCFLPIICNTVISRSPFVDSSIFAADNSPRARNYFSVLFSSFIALYHVVRKKCSHPPFFFFFCKTLIRLSLSFKPLVFLHFSLSIMSQQKRFRIISNFGCLFQLYCIAALEKKIKKCYGDELSWID